MSSLVMINEDRMDGFGGGKDAIKEVIAKRTTNDWGPNGMEGGGGQGAKGQTYKGPTSFEVYFTYSDVPRRR